MKRLTTKPEKWFLKITEENLAIADKWRGENAIVFLSYKLKVGYTLLSKHHKDKSCVTTIPLDKAIYSDYTELSTADFIRFFVNESKFDMKLIEQLRSGTLWIDNTEKNSLVLLMELLGFAFPECPFTIFGDMYYFFSNKESPKSWDCNNANINNIKAIKPSDFLIKKDKSIYKRAIKHFGERKQLEKLREECLELALALTHYFDGKATEEEVRKEGADVAISLKYLKILMPFKAEKKEKLERLKELIKNN